jgi:RND family efflux transporter MFP subunit
MIRIAIVSLLLLMSVLSIAQDGSPVEVVMPVERGLTEQLLLSGSLTAQQDAALSSRAAGLVSELLVDVGDQVKQGQPLLKLDTALAGHELTQREATMHVAEVQRNEAIRQVNEAEQLAGKQLFPQTELALRRADLARSEAILEQARAAYSAQNEILARHILTAPFSGVIAARHTDVGEYVSLGTQVLQLVAPTPLLLDVQMPQEYYTALDDLQSIKVRSDIEPGSQLDATLIAAVPVSDLAARSFLVRLQVDSERQLLPGTSASAIFHFEQGNGGVKVVPPDALLRHPDGNFSLFSVREGKAWRHVVKIGRSNEDGVEILDGLPSGEPVVIRGNEILRDGQPVHIREKQD